MVRRRAVLLASLRGIGLAETLSACVFPAASKTGPFSGPSRKDESFGHLCPESSSDRRLRTLGGMLGSWPATRVQIEGEGWESQVSRHGWSFVDQMLAKDIRNSGTYLLTIVSK